MHHTEHQYFAWQATHSLVELEYPASDFRCVQLGIHEQRELERPANGQYVLFCEDQFTGPLPVGTQLAFLVHARHVIARIADGAQRTTVFGRQGGSLALGRDTQDATTWRINSSGPGQVESGLSMDAKLDLSKVSARNKRPGRSSRLRDAAYTRLNGICNPALQVI
jgi:hypothetical protein